MAQKPGLIPAPPGALKRWWARGLEVLFPARCAACEAHLDGAPNAWFCAACWGKVAPPQAGGCARCGIPLAALSPSAAPVFPAPQGDGTAEAGWTCLECQKAPPPFARARTLGVYGGALAAGVRLLKYRHQTGLAEALVSRAAASEVSELWRVDVVAPVPLHAGRLKRRGYNQSAWLARAVGKRVEVRPEDLLTRTRATRPQVGLKRAEREANVKGAFAVERPDRVAGRVVLLVDDVITTGSTAAACARALKKAGAARVHVWAVARQGPGAGNGPEPG
jgi:ComF family protein